MRYLKEQPETYSGCDLPLTYCGVVDAWGASKRLALILRQRAAPAVSQEVPNINKSRGYSKIDSARARARNAVCNMRWQTTRSREQAWSPHLACTRAYIIRARRRSIVSVKFSFYVRWLDGMRQGFSKDKLNGL